MSYLSDAEQRAINAAAQRREAAEILFTHKCAMRDSTAEHRLQLLAAFIAGLVTMAAVFSLLS